jgi:hypothetical protein
MLFLAVGLKLQYFLQTNFTSVQFFLFNTDKVYSLYAKGISIAGILNSNAI